MDDYTPASSLLSPGRIGQARWADALAARIPREEADEIAALYHHFAPGHNINPDLALAQFCEETGYGTSDRWRRQRNPCGLGITSDDVPGHDFGKPSIGIAAHYHHLCCYAYDASTCPVNHGFTPDFRHDFHDGNPALSHLQDDARKWATKPGYVGRILAIANAILALSAPPSEEKGPGMGIQAPPIDTSHPSPNRGYNNGHQHRNDAIIDHITDGTNSLGWLTNPDSNASSNYLIRRDGHIYELVPPGQSAWANGEVNQPNRANPLVAKWLEEGCNFNQRVISIEHECTRAQKLTIAQLAASVWLHAWLVQAFGIPLTAIFGHNQIDSVNRKYCPGWSGPEWAAILTAVQDRLGVGQEGDDVREPGAGQIEAYINSKGEAVIVWNAGGTATKILGVNAVDLGVSVQNEQEEGKPAYDRSIQGNVSQPWAKRTA